MATVAASPTYAGTTSGEQTGLWSWLTTVDHKRIGVLYLYTSLFFFIFGGVEAVIIRAQLMGPNRDLVSAEMYNQLFTMHGTTMIFLAIMPLSAAFFNFLIPLQIGARDVAFPRLNAFSYWVYLFGGLFITLPIFFGAAPDGGWFGYTPLSTRQFSQGLNLDFWVLGLQILGISSLAAAFNFITTIINLRAPGMNLMRMPMFTWMSFVVQFLLILAFPVITIALVFLQFDRFFGTNFYAIGAGGDPLLWQHLFWIFGHPEVYILILPAFGLVSEVLPTNSKKPLFGYPVMVYSGILIGFLGFGVWAHHMFSVGMGPIADTVFGLTTLLIAIPTGVKIFNWIFTMWGGSLRFTTAMKFAIGLVALFTIGGISGVSHASPPADLQQTDTYYIVAHFHYVLFGGSIMGIFAGIYHYFPKMFGRMMDERLGNWHFWLNFIAMNLTFFPMHMSGLLGMPRRIYTYDAGQGWDTFNMISSIGAFLLVPATAIFIWNFFRSKARGPVASDNPWDAATLEWSIPSPPPEYNFAQIPLVESRYPLWDVTHPERTAEIPHTHEGWGDQEKAADAKPVHVETERRTAKELGIPMPLPTIKPLLVALSIIVMFSGLLFIHRESKTLALTLMLGGAMMLAGFLYAWLLSPLEEAH
ncbi:MAG TPA: cytochrome c oxidase subunit I [Gemmatimonadaceae bacterium]|jgi:cytochrome c oxidase subunit 1|nr:cytochrome c oxidase subunit I [Gemmatimonadaceae bacterium]